MLLKWHGKELYKPLFSKLVGLKHNGLRPYDIILTNDEVARLTPEYQKHLKEAIHHAVHEEWEKRLQA